MTRQQAKLLFRLGRAGEAIEVMRDLGHQAARESQTCRDEEITRLERDLAKLHRALLISLSLDHRLELSLDIHEREGRLAYYLSGK